MDKRQRYRGIMTATPTPLDASGKVSVAAVREHVESQIRHGITGILPIGGTGELSLSPIRSASRCWKPRSKR